MLDIWIDGASRGNPGPSSCAAVFKREGVLIHQASKVIGERETNNVAEYRALLGALRYLPQIRLPDEPVMIHSDSKLLVEQVAGRWSCKQPHLQTLLEEAQRLLEQQQPRVGLRNIPREWNEPADRLCNYALDAAGYDRDGRRTGPAHPAQQDR